jgi:type III restriction enzyme
VAGGYLHAAGDIQDKFDPKNPHFELKVPEGYKDFRTAITDTINSKVFKNRIVNARDRRELKFRKEVQPSETFKKLWEKIKPRTPTA